MCQRLTIAVLALSLSAVPCMGRERAAEGVEPHRRLLQAVGLRAGNRAGGRHQDRHQEQGHQVRRAG